MFENYCINYHQSIICFKLTLKNEFIFPIIKKVVIFFVMNTKYYNKNMLYLYLLILICFYCNVIMHNKEINKYQAASSRNFCLGTKRFDVNNIEKLTLKELRELAKIHHINLRGKRKKIDIKNLIKSVFSSRNSSFNGDVGEVDKFKMEQYECLGRDTASVINNLVEKLFKRYEL